MAAAERRKRDVEMASYMKRFPNRFPDSAMRPWQGNGADLRKEANRMGRVLNNTSGFDIGMLGGYLCAKLGLGNYGVDVVFDGPRSQMVPDRC